MPPSPVSWAKLPWRAPSFSASTALADRAPKLMAETLKADIEYGWVQSGPPTVMREIQPSSAAGTGASRMVDPFEMLAVFVLLHVPNGRLSS